VVSGPAPGPGELLLRVTACGLCGSDVKARDAMPAGTIMAFDDLTRVAADAKILVRP
jgi:(R,R)-butanediol dehydrogenase/meso-butanediol dehydrogenase/diacetyl reductase